MTDPILALLAATALALMALGMAAAWFGPRARQGIGLAACGVAGLGAMLALIWLLLAAVPVGLTLPIGLAEQAFSLALDPLSALFLALVLAIGAVVVAFAAELDPTDEPVTLAGIVLALGALALTLLAGDAAGQCVGLSVAGAAIWSTGPAEARHTPLLGLILLTVSCVAGVVALTTSTDTAPLLPAIVNAESPRGVLALGLVLLGPGLLAALAPVVAARDGLTTRVGAVITAGVVPVALYLVLRLTFAGTGSAPPAWWAAPVLALGAVILLAGGWSAARAPTLDGVIAGLVQHMVGIVAICLGLALAARSADRPDLGASAMGAALLAGVTAAVAGTLAMLAVAGVRQAAGTAVLVRLGGLIRQMPMTSGAMLAAMWALAALPPGLGFAAVWLLLQALLAWPPLAGVATGWIMAVLFAVLACSGALVVAACLRLLGVAFLGRARGPRSSAAEEVTVAARPFLMALTGLSVLLGLLPGLLPAVAADPAIVTMVGTHIAGRTGILTLTAAADARGYAPLPLTALAVLAALPVLRWSRRGTSVEQERPAWNDGFAPSPPWLPFGDPLTQTDGSGFVPDLPSAAMQRPGFALPRLRRLHAIRPSVGWVMLGVVGLLVLAVAVRGGP